MLKVDPAPGYPPEEGRYLRGNHYSPVAVIIILNTDADKIPPEIETLVRVGIESGAALSGTVQTPNIGLEKIVCNIIANPNCSTIQIALPCAALDRAFGLREAHATTLQAVSGAGQQG